MCLSQHVIIKRMLWGSSHVTVGFLSTRMIPGVLKQEGTTVVQQQIEDDCEN